MLDELAIENLGLIETLRVSLERGFVVVTGETGTGKTMLVGGLRLLLGETARRDAVGPTSGEARVEGRFVFADDELVVRRVVTAKRSRAYIDGTMATADELTRTLSGSVEIVAQHDHLSLRQPHAIRALLDAQLDQQGRTAATDYTTAHRRTTELRQAALALGGDRRALEREQELAAFQAEEIGAAGLTVDLEIELLDQARRLRHREELMERFDAARISIETARESIGFALDELRKAVSLDGTAETTEQLVASVAVDLAEADGGVRSLAEDLPHDPADLAAVESRLSQINDLKRKYGDSVEDVLAFAKAAAARSIELLDLLARADSLADELMQSEADLAASGARLRVARLEAGSRLGATAKAHLQEMGMGEPVVRFSVTEAEPGPVGADRCELLFASDDRLAPAAVQRVASGGELSRLVLALRLAAGAGDRPVLVFDEVDAGVGGETGQAVGRKLAQLAESGQVLCVTHLPQVAAFADMHLVVERDGNRSTVRTVTEAERPKELARMLSGMAESDDARRHAAELLAAARETRQ